MDCGQQLQTLKPCEADEGHKVDELRAHRINFDAFPRFFEPLGGERRRLGALFVIASGAKQSRRKWIHTKAQKHKAAAAIYSCLRAFV